LGRWKGSDVMIKTSQGLFEGMECIQLDNGKLSLWVTSQVGPRVLGLSLNGGENMFYVDRDAKIPVEGKENYSLRGGHRLWYAPERPETTYIADDLPPATVTIQNGLELIQNVDAATGIQKSWQVILDEKEARVTLDHKLTNLGADHFQLAPWAVTMLRAGGRGLIPLQVDNDDQNGLWPNRHLVFWPYTNMKSPYLNIDNRAVSIEAKLTDGALKIGTANPMGWMAYSLEGILFVKNAVYDKDANYLDRRASSQMYCNKDVIELETLGPVVKLAPGDSVEHQETWQIYPEGNWPAEIGKLFGLFHD